MKPGYVLHVDLSTGLYKPLSDVFTSLRPDIAVTGIDTIHTLKLTVCHESNLLKSKQYKTTKYASLSDNCVPAYSDFTLTLASIEVTTLGLISNISSFCRNIHIESLPDNVKCKMVQSVLSNSFSIYCNRNNTMDAT